jgi:hypothetical protein
MEGVVVRDRELLEDGRNGGITGSFINFWSKLLEL